MSGLIDYQVTGYGHRDENNEWEVERCLSTPGYGDKVILSGDMVQLRHKATGRYLTVLPDIAAITEQSDNRVGSSVFYLFSNSLSFNCCWIQRK